MFHRVKSEVQSGEQDQQEPENRFQSSDPGQRTTGPLTKKETSESGVMSQDRPQGVSYGKIPPITQEETSSMAKQDNTKAKQYAAESEGEDTSSNDDQQGSAGGYNPSISRAGGYSPSYGGSSYTAPQAPEPYTGGDRTLTIGRGINMSGEIEACDHLMVEGTVEAALKGAKLLEIAESGTFYGTVEIEEATIAGRFEGDITVSGRLTLKSSGVITGSIAYREIEVESGAILDGRMTPLKPVADQKKADNYRAGSEASAMAKGKESGSKKTDREPANTESGLFSRARDTYR